MFPPFAEQESEIQSGEATCEVRGPAPSGREQSPQQRARGRARRSPGLSPDPSCRGAPTFPGPSPAHGPLRTTLPGRTRARARAQGPPPWRLYCPGRSSSRVRSRSLATTPPPRGLGRLGGEALGAKRVGACSRPQRSFRRTEASRCSPRGLGSVATRGREGRTAGWGSRAWGEPGRIQGGTAGGMRGWWLGAGRRCCGGDCQSARRRHPKGRAGEGSILSGGAADHVPQGPGLLLSWAGPGGEGRRGDRTRATLWSSLST